MFLKVNSRNIFVWLLLLLSLIVVVQVILLLLVSHPDSSLWLSFFRTPNVRISKSFLDQFASIDPSDAESLDFLLNKPDDFISVAAHQSQELCCNPYFGSDGAYQPIFNWTLCKINGFKVATYPGDANVFSQQYRQLIQLFQNLSNFELDASKACLYLAPIDTLDRDILSTDYVQFEMNFFSSQKFWSKGRNHLVFNMFVGTWPDYEEQLDFDIDNALLLRASFSDQYYRPNCDISLPLIAKDYAVKRNFTVSLYSKEPFPSFDGDRGITKLIGVGRQFLLSFKGKRYLTGLSSSIRSILYHLDNNDDILVLTTCKHGKDWEKLQDKRCATDNLRYDQYDYDLLLKQSVFCLTPRGRRIGSFRFIESMQYGCIPILVSNGYVLPFMDVIDWHEAAVAVDEGSVFQIPSLVRFMSDKSVYSLRRQNRFLYDTYFSSLDRIIASVLKLLEQRIFPERTLSKLVWNRPPGALFIYTDYRTVSQRQMDPEIDLPFYGTPISPTFSAVLVVTDPINSTALHKTVESLSKSNRLTELIVLWSADAKLLSVIEWPLGNHVSVIVKRFTKPLTTESMFHFIYSMSSNQGIVLLNCNFPLLDQKLLLLMHNVWLDQPMAIVGFRGATHNWQISRRRYSVSLLDSRVASSEYSVVMLWPCMLHRYYAFAFLKFIQDIAKYIPYVDKSRIVNDCADLWINGMISYHVKISPKLVSSTTFASIKLEAYLSWMESQQICLQILIDYFGYSPLIRSNVRYDLPFYAEQTTTKVTTVADFDN